MQKHIIIYAIYLKRSCHGWLNRMGVIISEHYLRGRSKLILP